MKAEMKSCGCASHNQHVEVTIHDDEWQDTGPDETEWGRVTGPPLIINGVHHHLEGIALDERGEPSPGAWAGDFESLQEVNAGQWHTMNIRGREYAIYMTPFCQ